MKLDFIVIGGQKCGSTYIQEVINQHPDVDMVKGECPHFESPDYENGGLKKLENLIKELDHNKLIGIKRPNYLSRPEVPSRIKSQNKNVKLITILRNPVDRLKSAYFHNMNDGFAPVLALNTGVEKLLNGELNKKYPRTKELLEFGFYGKFIKNYLELFDENLLVLTYDELRKDKLAVIKKCYSFLNIDDNFIPHQWLNTRPQKVNYSLLRTHVLTKKNRFTFDYNDNRTRLSLKNQSLLDKIICKNIDLLDRFFLNKFIISNKKPEFTPEIKQQLLEIYASDIEDLESLLSIDLSNWKKTSA